MQQRGYREKLYATYHTEHYSQYAGRAAAASERAHDLALTKLYRPRFPQVKDPRIVDAGAGSGALVATLIRAGYRDAQGFDVSEEQVRVARHSGLPVACSAAQAYFQDDAEGFDVITAIDLLEHFTRDEGLAFLGSCIGALRPGGVLIVQTANGGSPVGQRVFAGDLTHETLYTGSTLREAMSVSGFADVSVTGSQTAIVRRGAPLLRALRGVLHAIWRLQVLAEWGVRAARAEPATMNLLAAGYRRP